MQELPSLPPTLTDAHTHHIPRVSPHTGTHVCPERFLTTPKQAPTVTHAEGGRILQIRPIRQFRFLGRIASDGCITSTFLDRGVGSRLGRSCALVLETPTRDAPEYIPGPVDALG